GLTKKWSARSQKIADIPEAFFVNTIKDHIESDEPIKPMKLLRAFLAAERADENEALRQHGAIVPDGTTSPRFRFGTTGRKRTHSRVRSDQEVVGAAGRKAEANRPRHPPQHSQAPRCRRGLPWPL